MYTFTQNGLHKRALTPTKTCTHDCKNGRLQELTIAFQQSHERIFAQMYLTMHAFTYAHVFERSIHSRTLMCTNCSTDTRCHAPNAPKLGRTIPFTKSCTPAHLKAHTLTRIHACTHADMYEHLQAGSLEFLHDKAHTRLNALSVALLHAGFHARKLARTYSGIPAHLHSLWLAKTHHMQARTHACTLASTLECTHAQSCRHTRMLISKLACTHACMHTRLFKIRAYTHAHLHQLTLPCTHSYTHECFHARRLTHMRRARIHA
jgi:hypothetical protein